jgi:hypothetical protein
MNKSVFSVSEIIYYVLISICFLLSLKASSTNIKGLFWIRILLIVALTTEAINEFLEYYTAYGGIIAHFYLVFEHVAISFFIISNLTSQKLIQAIKFVAIIFVICSLLASFRFQNFKLYPGVQYNVNCIIIIVWVSILMFKIDVVDSLKISAIPLFWLLSGLLLFYSGIFFFNGTYGYILTNNKELAIKYRLYINLTLNYLFYLVWSYSFICSIRLQK